MPQLTDTAALSDSTDDTVPRVLQSLEGDTALHSAAQFGQVAAVRLLLEVSYYVLLLSVDTSLLHQPITQF